MHYSPLEPKLDLLILEIEAKPLKLLDHKLLDPKLLDHFDLPEEVGVCLHLFDPTLLVCRLLLEILDKAIRR